LINRIEENIEAQVNILNDILINLIHDINESKNIYFSNKNIQKKLPYLSGWFESRTEVLETWSDSFKKAISDYEFIKSDEYSHYLNQTQSMSQGFDIDTEWCNASRRIEYGVPSLVCLAKSILLTLSNKFDNEKLERCNRLHNKWKFYKNNPELVDEID